MPKSKIKGPQPFEGYKGILAKRLPFDPHWTAIKTFTGLRALATLNTVAANAPKAAANNNALPNLFAPKFFPPDLDDRIAALYKAHGVDYGDDDALLFALATTHVPGLTTESAAHGPARSWTVKQRAALKIAVDQHVAEKVGPGGKHVTIAAACMHLAAKEPWKSLLRAKRNPRQAMRKQYDLAEDVWVAFVRYERWANEHPEEEAKLRRQDARRE